MLKRFAIVTCMCIKTTAPWKEKATNVFIQTNGMEAVVSSHR